MVGHKISDITEKGVYSQRIEWLRTEIEKNKNDLYLTLKYRNSGIGVVQE